MTEKAYFFTTGGAGDGASTYTQDDLSNAFKVIAACMDEEGVAPAYLNALAGSTTGANNARIASGGAMVDGKPYYNSANVDTVIPSAVGGGNTRIDRIVLRADWAARTVRVTRIAGTDAASPSAPSITQTPGTTYDITLCQALVNTSGTVTITDERVLARPGTATITSAALRDSAALSVIGRSANSSGVPADIAASADGDVLRRSGTSIAFGQLTAANITDRTRTIFVPAFAAAGGENRQWGVLMADGASINGYANYHVPSDFASTMTVAPIVVAANAGNMRWNMYIEYGAVTEVTSTHSVTVASTTTAVGNDTREALAASALSSAAAGDYISILFTREGSDGADTINGAAYLSGFLVSYTADS